MRVGILRTDDDTACLLVKPMNNKYLAVLLLQRIRQIRCESVEAIWNDEQTGALIDTYEVTIFIKYDESIWSGHDNAM